MSTTSLLQNEFGSRRDRTLSKFVSFEIFETENSTKKMEDPPPEYTEFGIKIHKFRLTFKVQKHPHQQQHQQQQNETEDQEPRPQRTISRHNSTASSVADSLRLLDLDTTARSRRPLCQEGGTRTANWEFQGFYSPARTSTPSSGYSSAAVSRTSSFSSRIPESRSSRIHSADDSAYSEVYSTIEELSELADPFDDDDVGVNVDVDDDQLPPPPTQLELARAIARSKSSLGSSRSSTLSKRSSGPPLPPKSSVPIPPPLPPRMASFRAPARPPYPSSIVRAVQEITGPLNR